MLLQRLHWSVSTCFNEDYCHHLSSNGSSWFIHVYPVWPYLILVACSSIPLPAVPTAVTAVLCGWSCRLSFSLRGRSCGPHVVLGNSPCHSWFMMSCSELLGKWESTSKVPLLTWICGMQCFCVNRHTGNSHWPPNQSIAHHKTQCARGVKRYPRVKETRRVSLDPARSNKEVNCNV